MDNAWHDIRYAPPPVNTELRVEVRNHTGLYLLPFNVVYDGATMRNAVKRLPVDPTLKLIRWKWAR